MQHNPTQQGYMCVGPESYFEGGRVALLLKRKLFTHVGAMEHFILDIDLDLDLQFYKSKKWVK